MRRVFLIITLLFLVTGCSSIKPKVYSKIDNTNKEYLSVHYPITNNKVFDDKVSNYVENKYKTYKKNFPSSTENEFNVDFKYKLIDDRYDSLLLKIFYTAPTMAHPVVDGEAFNYDRKEKKFLTLGDIIPKDKFSYLTSQIKQELLKKHSDCIFKEELDLLLGSSFEKYSFFTFDNEKLYIYFHPYDVAAGYCGILEVAIDLKSLSPLITFDSFEESVLEPVISKNSRVIDPTKPVIAFTFDDGPSNYTIEIANVLKNYNGSGTFFVVGNKVNFYKNDLRTLVENGNEIGNHSFNHQWMSRMSAKEFKDQIDKTQEKVKEATGVLPTRIRPTYGSMNDLIRKNTNLTVSMWNVDPKDWKYKDAKTIAKRILSKASDGKVVLLHDTHYRSLEALKIVLPELAKSGYQFVTLSELDEIELIRKNSSKAS